MSRDLRRKGKIDASQKITTFVGDLFMFSFNDPFLVSIHWSDFPRTHWSFGALCTSGRYFSLSLSLSKNLISLIK
jgi:hypothetical protein